MPDYRAAGLIERLRNEPWAMHPDALAALVRRVEEAAEKPEAARSRPAASVAGSVAVLPLQGAIDHKASLFSDTSVEEFEAAFDAAVASPDIGGILIDIDSPGGSVAGVPELADKIRGARGSKPIVAVANSWAASAAYWIGTAADELVVTPSGEVGSIGVWTAHVDASKFYEDIGLNVSIVYAGKYKVEANPFGPLTDEARANIQAGVDRYYGMFTEAVAKARGVRQSTVVNGFGQGRMVGAHAAVEERMADRVETREQALARLTKRVRRAGGRRASIERRRLALKVRSV